MYKKILIPAKLERVPTGQFVVDTDAVYDKLIHKSQEEINQITTSRLETLENELEVSNKGSLSVNLIARTNEEENNHQEDLIGATITLSSNLDVIREATYNGEPVLFEDLDQGNYTITVSERDFGSHNEKNYATPSPENITILPGNQSNATLIYDQYKYTISIGGDNLPPDTTIVNINVKPTITYSFTFETLKSNPVYTTHKLSEEHFAYTKEFPYLGIDGYPDSDNKDVFNVETTINNYLVIITYTQETFEYSFVVRKEYIDEITNEQMFDYESEIFENKIFKIILLGDREEQTTDIQEINWYSKIKGGETTVVYNNVLEDHLPCLKFVHKLNRKYQLVYPPISGYTGTSMKRNDITTSTGDVIFYTENTTPKSQVTVNINLTDQTDNSLNFKESDGIVVYLKNTTSLQTIYKNLNINLGSVTFENVDYGNYIVYIPSKEEKGYTIVDPSNSYSISDGKLQKSLTVESAQTSISFNLKTYEYNIVVTGLPNDGGFSFNEIAYKNGDKIRISPEGNLQNIISNFDYIESEEYNITTTVQGYTITIRYSLIASIQVRLIYYVNGTQVNNLDNASADIYIRNVDTNAEIRVSDDSMEGHNEDGINYLYRDVYLNFGEYEIRVDTGNRTSAEYPIRRYVLDSNNITENIQIKIESDEYTLNPTKDGVQDTSLTFTYNYGQNYSLSSIQTPYKLIVPKNTAINQIIESLGVPEINGYTYSISSNNKTLNIIYISEPSTLNIYAYYSDGSKRSAANADSSAIGIGVDTENGTYLILKTQYTCSNPYTLLTNEQYAEIENTKYRNASYSEYASQDMDGQQSTINIRNIFRKYNYTSEDIPFEKADNVERGFIGTAGEWILLMQNYYEIKQVAVAIGMLRSMEDTDMDFIGITSTLKDNKNNCITVSYNGVGENPAIGYASTDLTYYILKKLS